MTLMYLFLQYHDTLKCINHGKKISKLPQPNESWLAEVLAAYELKNFCWTRHGYIDYGLLSVFVERWHSKT